MSKGSTRGFSSAVLALPVSEQWEQTAYVILGREREGRRLQRGRPQGVSKREREAGQKRGLQTWRDAKQKQMTFLSSSMICLIKPVWDCLLADRLTLEDRWCYHTTSESCIVRKTPQSY